MSKRTRAQDLLSPKYFSPFGKYENMLISNRSVSVYSDQNKILAVLLERYQTLEFGAKLCLHQMSLMHPGFFLSLEEVQLVDLNNQSS